MILTICEEGQREHCHAHNDEKVFAYVSEKINFKKKHIKARKICIKKREGKHYRQILVRDVCRHVEKLNNIPDTIQVNRAIDATYKISNAHACRTTARIPQWADCTHHHKVIKHHFGNKLA